MTQQAYPIRCRIRNEGGEGPTRVDVYDDIGPGDWFSDGLTAKDFAAQLAKVTGPLQVNISSGGGDVFDGIAIANAIRSYKGGPKTTINDGIAASIASVIFQAGDERVMQQGSMCMIHDAFGVVLGNASEARKFADTLDQVSDNIAGIYASRAGGTAEDWRTAMKAETWYTADEAVAAGLADRVGDGTAELPAGLDVAAFAAVPGRIAAALRKMPQAKAPAVAGGGGGSGGPATLTVTAGSPSVSYTTGSGGGSTSFAVAGGSGGTPPVIVNADGSHDPWSGSHSHAHTASGDQGGDATHDHSHDHNADAEHGHVHAADHGPKVTAKAGKKGKKAAKKARLKGDASGACCSLCGPDCACGGAPAAQGRRRSTAVTVQGRILGAESMPLLNEALAVHHTATVDKPWDGPAAVAAMPADAKVLRYCHAWQDTASDDGQGDDPDGDADDKKASYKFPHHTTKGGPANLAACRNGLARLSSADIPDSDRAGVKAHLQAHLSDGGSDDADAGNHAHTDLTGIDLDQIRAALKGANE